MNFFKVFEDTFQEPNTCFDKLNKYLEENPDLKVVSSETQQVRLPKNIWDPSDYYLSNRVTVQFYKPDQAFKTRGPDPINDAWEKAFGL